MNQTAIETTDLAGCARAEPLAVAVGNFAHELANPLNAIAITTELAQRMLSRGQNARAAEALDKVNADCERCARLLRDAQDYFSLEVGPHDVVELTAMLEEISQPLRDSGEVVIRATGACRLDGDARALRRLFREVLRNAFDHGAHRVAIELQREPRTVSACIGDDGPGIDPALRARVFEAFFSTQRLQHSGIGLTLARSIARMHRGEIEIENAEQGAMFRITLPA